MHLRVFVKLKKTIKTLSSGQKNPKKPKKTQKNPKNPKKTKKTQKNPLGWIFLKKPGFFPTLWKRGCELNGHLNRRNQISVLILNKRGVESHLLVDLAFPHNIGKVASG